MLSGAYYFELSTKTKPPTKCSSILFEAPNEINLRAERPDREEILRYQRARSTQALHKASAKPWACGIPMKQAIKIVRDAVGESQ